jgi:hypothetical protein
MVPVLKGFKKGLFSPKGTVRVKGAGKRGRGRGKSSFTLLPWFDS